MEQSWQLPGFEVQELLGFGATGEVWRAVDSSTGTACALKRLQPPHGVSLTSPAARDRLRHDGARLVALSHPHLLRLLRVLGTADGAVLVHELAVGGSLASLLVERGPLTADEVASVVGPVAEALAVAHRRGVTHGGVTAGDVLFDDAGAPLLGDVGVAALLREASDTGDDTDAAADLHRRCQQDVAALAELVVLAMTGGPVGLDGLDPHVEMQLRAAARSGDAAAFAAALAPGALPRQPTEGYLGGGRHRGGLPLPPPPHLAPAPAGPGEDAARHLRQRALAGAPGASRPGRSRRTADAAFMARAGGSRPVRIAVVAAASIVGIVAVLVTVGGEPPADPASPLAVPAAESDTVGRASRPPTVEPPTVGPSPSSAAAGDPSNVPVDRWQSVLAELDRRRAAAFATADPDLLSEIYAPGAPAAAQDAAVVTQLRERGLVAREVRHTVESLRVVRAAPDEVTLAVRDRLDGYRLLDAAGQVVAQRPESAATAYEVRLAPAPDAAGWRVVAVQ